MTKTLQCQMRGDCTHPATHIGEKGYLYCAEHHPLRQGWERCRKLRKWEMLMLEQGKPLPSYKPIRKPKLEAAHV